MKNQPIGTLVIAQDLQERSKTENRVQGLLGSMLETNTHDGVREAGWDAEKT